MLNPFFYHLYKIFMAILVSYALPKTHSFTEIRIKTCAKKAVKVKIMIFILQIGAKFG